MERMTNSMVIANTVLTFIVPIMLVNTVAAQGYNLLKMTPGLFEHLDTTQSEMTDVLVLLAEQWDARSFSDEAAAKRMVASERTAQAVSAMKDFALEQQQDFIPLLRNVPGVDNTGIESLWIVNAVLLRAGHEAIYTLSTWPQVKMIELNDIPELMDPVAREPAERSVNGHEPGHDLIGAPEIWAMGYTGYGTKVLIFDSGSDYTHPSLIRGYWWHNAPLHEAWAAYGDFAEDCSDHGTHVNGIATGLNRYTNDTTGVAFNANWMAGPINFSSCHRPFNQQIRSTFQTFEWALDPDGDPDTSQDVPDVINCSWRSGQYGCEINASTILYSNVFAAGIAIVNSGGNTGPEPYTVCCAAGINTGLVNSFAVGAVNSSGLIASFSSRGPSPCDDAGGSLAIKPEVTAPGVSVRSSVHGGGYGNFNGTSMAAPHVSGALLLLKEAFPYLDGETLLLALYFTAVDAGFPGEDNVYGMGIIHIPAAFDYLLDQGHVPVPPVSHQHDIVLVNVSVPVDVFCNNTVMATMDVQNAGMDTVFNMFVQHGLKHDTVPQAEYLWTGVLPPGEVKSISLPMLSGVPGGHQVLVTEISMPNGEEDLRSLNNIFKKRIRVLDNPFLYPETDSVFVEASCDGSQVVITLPGVWNENDRIEWYNAFSGGDLLGTGPELVTTLNAGENVFYTDIRSFHEAGKMNVNSSSIIMIDSNSTGLIFDALTPIQLKSVEVYAEQPGIRLIQLRNAEGGGLGTRTVMVPEQGFNRIELNFDIPAGYNYQLVKFGGAPLGMSISPGGIDYAVADLVNIKRATGFGTNFENQNYYGFFYHWHIETLYPCGRGEIWVTADSTMVEPLEIVSDTGSFVLSGDQLSIDFSAIWNNALSFQWDFGNGTQSSGQEVTGIFTEPGVYTVQVIALDSNGCVTMAQIDTEILEDVVYVSEPGQLYGSMSLFPNPAGNRIDVKFFRAGNHSITLHVYDLTGRRVMVDVMSVLESEPVTLNIEALTPGFYIIHAQCQSGLRFSNRFLKH